MGSSGLILQALAAEAAAFAGLFYLDDGLAQLVTYMTLHALACGLLTPVLLRLLPARYRGSPRRAAAFLFTIQFAIPFIGSLGVALGVLLALYLPRSTRELPWQEIDIPELPYRPIDTELQMFYSEGGLQQVLRDAADPEKRLKALIATRQMDSREAIVILRQALRDKTDDVRLLAYSMLEQKEKTLSHQIIRLQDALRTASDEQGLILQRRLAQLWWEMAYLGLAQGGLQRHYLENARATLLRLVDRRPRHGDYHLLGRVHLQLGQLDDARAAFEQAQALNAPPAKIQPYLAEVAFLQRDFANVRHHLSACPSTERDAGIESLKQAWL
ncbi:tetratricopeptide repeat protein [Marinobacter bohaiensis]|uniref:polysaccharide biosynthesis protein n=1 Tax=Marinobacter bohaiensis TaxID=2201898 RepID=UPI000DAE851E|nr:polysaccharide biosynthesis protein [Marinobacter bohaiensis]